MTEFYAKRPTKVVYNKTQRNKLWRLATERSQELDFTQLEEKCPALSHQIQKSYDSGRNIQSAVFSECVYAQTIANMFGLKVFVNCYTDTTYMPESVNALLTSYNLVPRYIYATEDKRRMLIQAGGCDEIDSALVTVVDLVIYTIEFKEPGAKTSEPDLPKYGEDGLLVVDNGWLTKNGQFKEMLKEQDGLNFFEIMGHNINDFSKESVIYAVSNNYINKLLNVICTEDKNGYLVMMPANQVQLWAQTEGEIRPSGRNHYEVWTPKALRRFLLEKEAVFSGTNVTVEKSNLKIRKARGGAGKISGYKITPLFFVYSKDCEDLGSKISFDIRKVQQLNPTIAGKVFFKSLSYTEVKQYYSL